MFPEDHLHLSGRVETDAVGSTAVVGHMSRQAGMLKKLSFQNEIN